MLRNCPDCENDATLGARFCRTCGGQIFPESEVTIANTRNYSPEQAAAAQFAAPETSSTPISASPQYATPEPVTESVNTARLYHPPTAPAYNYASERPKKSWKVLWITLAVICTMFLVSVGMVGFFISKQISRANVGSRKPGVVIPGGVPDVPEPPPAPGEAKNVTIDELKYPDATIEKDEKAAGQEIVEMVTEDSLDEVKEFYRDALGIEPTVEDKIGKSIVFITSEPSLFIINAEPDKNAPDKIKIEVVHPRLPFLDGIIKFGKKQKDGAPVTGAKIHEEIDRQKAEIDRQKAELDRQKEEINRKKEELQRQQENLRRKAPQNQ